MQVTVAHHPLHTLYEFEEKDDFKRWRIRNKKHRRCYLLRRSPASKTILKWNGDLKYYT